jgi:hypothetical protein
VELVNLTAITGNFRGGAGRELQSGGQQPLQQARVTTADGRLRQLRVRQGLLRHHCGKHNSSPVLAIGIWNNFDSVYVGLVSLRWALEEPPFGISLPSCFYMGIVKFDILAPVITDWVTLITYNS